MKETLDLRGLNFEEGYIAVIDKPLSWTSTDVVRKIKSALRRLGYRKIKVGHAGTLDPLATGVLLVCIGRATKMVDALQAEEKEYVADVMLGVRFEAGGALFFAGHLLYLTALSCNQAPSVWSAAVFAAAVLAFVLARKRAK